MTKLEALPAGRNVSLVTAGSYRWEAEHSVREARIWLARSRKLFGALLGRGRLTSAQSLRVRQVRGHARFFASTTVMFSGMAVEGFLNQYAVVRLGRRGSETAFLKKPTVEKARMLLLAVGATEPSKRSVLCRRIERLALQRNALVHPKTYEVQRGDEHLLIEDASTVAEACFEDMEFFFRDFETRDPYARSWTDL